MTLPRTVADVLTRHVSFEIESIDRMYCNVYQPRLQYPAAVAGFIRHQLGFPVASSAVLAPIGEAFVTAIRAFARDHRVPMVDFVKGQRKDDVMHEHLAGFDGDDGVLFIGRAQEKAGVFRTEKRRDSAGLSYPWIVRATAMVNQWYFSCADTDFGPFFLKFSSYFPYTAKLCINGNEYAKRQAVKAGIGFTALDNGFATCDDPATVQTICDGLSAEKIDALLRKWLRILPHPFTDADQDTGYRYDISILQAEFSLTQTLQRPVHGRIFFDQVIRDNLDIGRPDQVGLIFDRRIQRGRKRPTPGRFRTRIITDGVTPSLHIDYKTSKIKQYHKLGRAAALGAGRAGTAVRGHRRVHPDLADRRGLRPRVRPRRGLDQRRGDGTALRRPAGTAAGRGPPVVPDRAGGGRRRGRGPGRSHVPARQRPHRRRQGDARRPGRAVRRRFVVPARGRREHRPRGIRRLPRHPRRRDPGRDLHGPDGRSGRARPSPRPVLRHGRPRPLRKVLLTGPHRSVRPPQASSPPSSCPRGRDNWPVPQSFHHGGKGDRADQRHRRRRQVIAAGRPTDTCTEAVAKFGAGWSPARRRTTRYGQISHLLM